MAKWTCKGRARRWLSSQHILYDAGDAKYGPGHKAVWIGRTLRAVTKLMLEAHSRGYESGYCDGRASKTNSSSNTKKGY